jgi:hypothetical protein
MAVVALAGCTGDGGDNSGSSDEGGSSGGSDGQQDSDGDGVPDAEDDFPNDSDRSVLLGRESDTIDLNEDYYQTLEFDPSERSVLDYDIEVEEDIRIDVILTDDTNLNYFENGDDWEYYTEGSDLDTVSADEEVALEGGETYYLIIDHTEEGGAAPPTNFDNDRITVNVEYQLYR